MASTSLSLEFVLPTELEAAEPPEARGLTRDGVRLLVSNLDEDAIAHGHFSDLPRWLDAGDLLVVNISGTMNAALAASGPDGKEFALHVSTRLPGGFWTVELRVPDGGASLPYRDARAGMTLRLPAGGRATLLAPYPLAGSLESASRLWMAALVVPDDVPEYLARFGVPIRYGYVKRPWPSSMYQTVFATEAGSAEMPSAARPFTPELVTRLVSSGIRIAPIVLHTGVSSLEDHEPPYEEFYRVPAETAELVNLVRRGGHRVVAVGTTVVRALETVSDERGIVSPGQGWTNLVITRERPLRVVNALITGLHEPLESHLMMLERAIEAAAGTRPDGYAAQHLERAYQEAREAGYFWHEFGDSHLIVGAAQEPTIGRSSRLSAASAERRRLTPRTK